MTTPTINFTKANLDALAIPANAGERATYSDKRQPGLQIRVSHSGVKTFCVYRWVKATGKPQRVTLGRYPQMSIEQARDAARLVSASVEGGGNPAEERRARRAQATTLGEAFDDFLKARKNLSPRTIYDYERFMGRHSEANRTDRNKAKKPRKSAETFAAWQDKPIVSITKDMIEKRHAEMGAVSEAQANYAMRVLRAVLNFAAGKYEDAKGQSFLEVNPVKRLSQARAWYRVDRRNTVIRASELEAWFAAVLGLSSDAANGKAEDVRDYLLLLLFTGARRTEAAKLKWTQVDLAARTFTMVAADTKGKRPHTLPLSDYLYDILAARKQAAKKGAVYVFPGSGDKGYLVETRRMMEKVVEVSKVSFTPHDLRRTFITVAESLDIPAYALKTLLNHKMSGDVTAGYIVMDVERLRGPMQKITDYMLRAAKLRASADVSDIGDRKAG